MVTSVDGARESTRKFLEMMRRLCSLEILVRKLSRQVVTLHRQVTGMEGQVAFLAPLQPKLRQACALGRMDRQRGDAFQKKLIEAENELKVLRRCIDTTSTAATTTTTAGTATTTTAPRPAPPAATASSKRDPAPQNFPGWVGGLAHRAAGGLGRRPPTPPVPAAGFGENKEAVASAAAGSFDAGRGDAGAAV